MRGHVNQARRADGGAAALAPGHEHRFHAVVKPVGSMCGLDCTYSYYLHKEELLGQPRQPRISDEMLERSTA